MPSFTFSRRSTRGSNASTTVSPSSSRSSTLCSEAEFTFPEAAPRCDIPFVSLHRRPGLISLAEAQRTPEIVYHSVSALPAPEQAVPEFPPFCTSGELTVPLISLDAARARADIKYRREGFEMKEHRAHLLAVRAELFD